MNKDIFINLCINFSLIYPTIVDDLVDEGRDILKELGITYDDEYIYVESPEYDAKVSRSEFVTTNNLWDISNPSVYGNLNKITPLELNIVTIHQIEDILNRQDYVLYAGILSPLFECIGWILESRSGKWKIHFEGSATYNFWTQSYYDEGPVDWKHPLGSYEDDADMIAEVTNGGTLWDWNKGDFLDGIKYDQIKNVNWLQDIDELQ